MNILDLKEEINFNDNVLTCQIIEINTQKVSLNNVFLKFQKNRTIIFKIFSDNELKSDNITKIKGTYFDYSFYAIVREDSNNIFHKFDNVYIFLVDIIEFSKNSPEFINSNKHFNIEIIPSQNFKDYIEEQIDYKRFLDEHKLRKYLENKNIDNENDIVATKLLSENNIKEFIPNIYKTDEHTFYINILNRDEELTSLFKLKDITYNGYITKYKYIMELYSLIFDTPILIEKIFINYSTYNDILFQSEYIDEQNIEILSKNIKYFSNCRIDLNLYEYLNNYIDFRNKVSTTNILLQLYFITDITNGKKSHNLNDISGFIDLFDGLFVELNELLGNKITSSLKNITLDKKIIFVLDYLENKERNHLIKDKEAFSKYLQQFRNMVRHQKPYKQFDLEKIYVFSKKVLKLYIFKYIIKIDDSKYNSNMLYDELDIFRLIEE